MQIRSKIVDIAGTKYHLRKLPPDVGSFIFMRILGISMRQQVNAPKPAKQPERLEKQPEEETVLSGETRIRALTFAVFSGGVISLDDFRLIQQSCMKVCGVVVERAGTPFPMPIMSDGGEWTAEAEDLSGSVSLVMRLTTEVLVFCFADFFGDGEIGL